MISDDFIEVSGCRGGKKKRAVRLVLGMMAGLWMWFGCLNLMQVWAAEGAVHFGSESYAWTRGDVCPLGVYFDGSIAVGSYSICLEYDPAVLEYLDGADRIEGNLLWVEGGGGENGYKRMLHFRPLTEGDTVVQMISAEGIGMIADEEGTITEDEFAIGQLAQAPIHIQKKDSSRLLALEAGQAEGMETFSPDVLEYHMQVEYEVEQLAVMYETEDEEAEVTLSGTELEVGRNVITLRVQGGWEDPVVYTLYVERKEAPAAGDVHAAFPLETEEGKEKGTGKESETEAEKGSGERIESGERNDGEAAGNGAAEDQEEGSTEGSKSGEEKLKPELLAALIVVFCMAVCYGRQQAKDLKKKRKPAEKRKRQKNTALKVINLEKKVIDVRHVTMNFRLAQDEASSLKEYAIRALQGKNHYRTLQALKDVSFEVKQGEVVGIIGTNGSGKSTLLKIIAGVLLPTSGEVVADRRKVQILTLGTGFDMELTARENVYLNGAIIGYSKEYIDEKYEEIVAFAELEGFMDERMKNFSSGMVSRLGFAIATMRDAADILILDEVLSVGDMFFRKKSEARIREMIHSGATVLIVSHSAGVIRKNCDKAVWIEKGVLQMVGKPEVVCRAYEKMEGKGETA